MLPLPALLLSGSWATAEPGFWPCPKCLTNLPNRVTLIESSHGPIAQLGERSVRIREVKGSNPSRSTNLPHRFCTMRRFLCSKNLGRPCRAPNPEVGCEPGGVINIFFENPSVSRFFLCILQSAAGKRIAFMPPFRKFLQKFPHHRRLIPP